jgi:hypothetical protein
MAVYTHLIGDDDHKVAAQRGEILRPDVPNFDLTKCKRTERSNLAALFGPHTKVTYTKLRCR